jgi:hypothetical protein
MKFASIGVRPSNVDEYIKQAGISDVAASFFTPTGMAKTIAAVSIITGVPIGVAAHVIGKRIKEMIDTQVNGVRIDPIILVTEHLKKGILGGNRTRPTMDDLKDSIGPQYDASLILSLWNDLAYHAQIGGGDSDLYFERDDLPADPYTREPVKDPIVEVHILKNKLGRMNYNTGGAVSLYKLYQEHTRLAPITDSTEHERYAQLL